MIHDRLLVLDPGLGITIQDRGRDGWLRYGVPPSGAMDAHAAKWACRLVDLPENSPVLEMTLQGARIEVLRDQWVALTGADASCNLPNWQATYAAAGTILEFPRNRSGVWTYLAVEGGFKVERLLGSASANPRCSFGGLLRQGDILRSAHPTDSLPSSIGHRIVDPKEQRDYTLPPSPRVWRGPQWDLFPSEQIEAFFGVAWTISSQSDRVGYRLEGASLAAVPGPMTSEPVLTGSIQVPGDGHPIVTMRDGPTVGGYPKLGLVDPGDVSWLAQCRPGQKVRFQSIS